MEEQDLIDGATLPVVVNSLPAATKEDAILKKYLQEISKIPLLTKEQEQQLANKYINDGDIEAANQLVTSYLKMVVKIAFGYRKYGLSVMDLISEGNLGLVRAVQKFDPSKGHRLSTYSSWWIKAAIQAFILRSWSLVKIGTTNMQKQLFFSLHKIKARLGLTGVKNLSDDQIKRIQDYTGASATEIKEMQMRTMSQDGSTNEIDNDGVEMQDRLSDGALSPEQIAENKDNARILHDSLKQAFNKLNDREKDILRARLLSDDKATLVELSKKFNISPERVRQVLASALQKMKNSI
jgi:RNA polymerase sigma-32 factor